MLSPFPLPPSEIPRILDASNVLLHQDGPAKPDVTAVLEDVVPASKASVLRVVVSKWGIDLDVLVRCRGTYMQATKIPTGSSIVVELPGLSEGYDVSGCPVWNQTQRLCASCASGWKHALN